MSTIPTKEAFRSVALLGLLMLAGSAAAQSQFAPLFRAGKGSGLFFVKRPGCELEPGVVGRAYPFGSEIKVPKDSKLYVFLSPNRQIHFLSGSEAVIADDPDNAGAKCVTLSAGSLETLLSIEEESVYPLSVKTDAALFDDFDGRVTILAGKDAATTRSAVHVVAGGVRIQAPQLMPSRIGTGAALVIATSVDRSHTEIDGKAGECKLLLENGSAEPVETAFHVGSRAKIWRQWAPLSKKLAVSVMLANADGAVANSYAFNEGEPPVQNGVADTSESGATASGEATVEETAQDGFAELGDDFSSGDGFDAPATPASETSGDDMFGGFSDFSFP